MKKKQVPFLSIFIICLAGVIGARYIFFNTPKVITLKGNHRIYTNEQDLFNYADVIAIGSVLNDLKDDNAIVKKDSHNYINDFYTISVFNIEKLLKGEIIEKVISVYQPVAITKDNDLSVIKLLSDDYIEMKKTSKYIVFLKRLPDGNYSVISGDQGKFNIDNTDMNEKEIQNDQVKKLKEQVINRIKQ